MFCIIKDGKTFQRRSDCGGFQAVDRGSTFDSIYDEVSQIRLLDARCPPDEGDWLYLDNGFAGVVKSYEINDGQLDVKCRVPLTIFDRKVYLPEGTFTPKETLEQTLANMIDEQYVSLSDEVYQLPYIHINVNTSTYEEIPPSLDEGLYSVKGYALKLRRTAGIYTTFVPKRDYLEVNIGKFVHDPVTIILPHKDYELIEQNVSFRKLGKITVINKEIDLIKNYYLLENGNVTDVYQSTNRVIGDWTTEFVSKDTNMLDFATEKFRENYYSHNITIKAKDKIPFGTETRIMLDDQLYHSYVAAVRSDPSSGLFIIQSGEVDLAYPPLRRL